MSEDDVEAVRWYRLAAEQGAVSAQFNLGGMYAMGTGVPEDAINAYAWLSIAAAQGDTQAAKLKKIVTELMTNETALKDAKWSLRKRRH